MVKMAEIKKQTHPQEKKKKERQNVISCFIVCFKELKSKAVKCNQIKIHRNICIYLFQSFAANFHNKLSDRKKQKLHLSYNDSLN